jgi:hypothetical protein
LERGKGGGTALSAEGAVVPLAPAPPLPLRPRPVAADAAIRPLPFGRGYSDTAAFRPVLTTWLAFSRALVRAVTGCNAFSATRG